MASRNFQNDSRYGEIGNGFDPIKFSRDLFHQISRQFDLITPKTEPIDPDDNPSYSPRPDSLYSNGYQPRNQIQENYISPFSYRRNYDNYPAKRESLRPALLPVQQPIPQIPPSPRNQRCSNAITRSTPSLHEVKIEGNNQLSTNTRTDRTCQICNIVFHCLSHLEQHMEVHKTPMLTNLPPGITPDSLIAMPQAMRNLMAYTNNWAPSVIESRSTIQANHDDDYQRPSSDFELSGITGECVNDVQLPLVRNTYYQHESGGGDPNKSVKKSVNHQQAGMSSRIPRGEQQRLVCTVCRHVFMDLPLLLEHMRTHPTVPVLTQETKVPSKLQKTNILKKKSSSSSLSSDRKRPKEHDRAAYDKWQANDKVPRYHEPLQAKDPNTIQQASGKPSLKDDDPNKRYKCNACDIRFTSKKSYSAHNERHHASNQIPKLASMRHLSEGPTNTKIPSLGFTIFADQNAPSFTSRFGAGPPKTVPSFTITTSCPTSVTSTMSGAVPVTTPVTETRAVLVTRPVTQTTDTQAVIGSRSVTETRTFPMTRAISSASSCESGKDNTKISGLFTTTFKVEAFTSSTQNKPSFLPIRPKSPLDSTDKKQERVNTYKYKGPKFPGKRVVYKGPVLSPVDESTNSTGASEEKKSFADVVVKQEPLDDEEQSSESFLLNSSKESSARGEKKEISDFWDISSSDNSTELKFPWTTILSLNSDDESTDTN